AADGYAGVAFFFVLSGFVLTWSLGDAPIEVRRFYRARFARIYPAFLVAFAISWAIVPPIAWWVVLSNATLTQAWLPLSHASPGPRYSIDLPTWSVSCEVLFYALLPLLVVLFRRCSAVRCAVLATAWFLACSAATYALPHELDRTRWQLIVYVNPVLR